MNPLTWFAGSRLGQSLSAPVLWVAKRNSCWQRTRATTVKSMFSQSDTADTCNDRAFFPLCFEGSKVHADRLNSLSKPFFHDKVCIYWPAKASCCLLLISSQRHLQSEEWDSALKVCKRSWLVTGTHTTGNACLYPDVATNGKVMKTVSSFKQAKQKMSSFRGFFLTYLSAAVPWPVTWLLFRRSSHFRALPLGSFPAPDAVFATLNSGCSFFHSGSFNHRRASGVIF